jgi:glycerol-3-phosphate dehydrogenase subunit C
MAEHRRRGARWHQACTATVLRRTRVRAQLDWSAYDSCGAGLPVSGGGFGKAVAVCIGNRQCQRDGLGVMCPRYRATADVAHSTRHRAATLRAALNGELGPTPFAGPELAAAMELCVGCKGCKRECPNGTDMALLRSEARAQRWRALGRVPLRERLLAGVPHWLPRLRHAGWLLRLRERVPFVARFVEAVFGLSARRSSPRIAACDFLSDSDRDAPAAGDGREVALLVDTFSNQLDPLNAQAALELLQAAGYRVHVPRARAGEPPLCCGRSWLSSGMIGEARAQASRTLAVLAPLVERGVPVIGLEPSCLLMLRDEYYALGLGGRVDAVAKSALLLEEFLAREIDAGRFNVVLRLPAGSRAAVHGHCHQKAFGAMKAMRKVLAQVQGLETEFIESGCCGMAGGFGFEAEHFDVSMRMGELALLPAVRALDPRTLVIANGTSCRHQIRDGAARESLHLSRLLRLAVVE